MKRILQFSFIAIIFLFLSLSSHAITVKIEVPIIKNGASVTDTIDGKPVTYDVSSDDAEQENNKMDKLYDDDIDVGWEGAPDDQNILSFGLRFQNVNIPKGAIIDTAYISFYSHEVKSVEDLAKITIDGEASDNPVTYDLQNLITDRPSTTAKVKWTVAEDWSRWAVYRTPNLKEIVQEIVNRQGWKPGNALAIMLKGENQGPSDFENAREFESFENISDPEEGGDGQNHPERVPRLIVYYTAPSGVIMMPIMKNGASVTDTIDGKPVTYDVSSDDAEQENDKMDKLYDDDIDVGWEGAPDDQNILNFGLRFQNIHVPNQAKIDSAFITFYSHENKSVEDVAKITIDGEASDNPVTYDLETLITARPSTSAKVKWTVAEDWTRWNVYRTPNLKEIVQEIVNRQGWKPGNAMAIMLKGENQGPSDFENAREFESFENISDPEEGGDGQNHPERVPLLSIYFSSMTDVEEYVSGDEYIRVMPNPVINGEFTVYSQLLINSDITMVNSLGTTVKIFCNIASERMDVDIEELPSGIYYFNIIKDNTTYTQKIVKY